MKADDNQHSASSFAVVFVTAGELPVVIGLQATQVIEVAQTLAKNGHPVMWISVVPIFSYIKDRIFRTKRIQSVREKCKDLGISFEYVIAPLTLSSPWAFIFRQPVLRWASKKLNHHLKRFTYTKTILHARSYYAADLALKIKSQASSEAAWFVSFDMRSVFPEELSLTHAVIGKACFGFAKQWEHELLQKSDITFLPLNYARERIHDESGCHVNFAPIHGFQREKDWQVDFDQRWSDRVVGYAGSIEPWHDPDILVEMLEAIPGSFPKLATSPHKRLVGFDFKSYRHDEMPRYYDGLLCLVIPGRKDFENYFVSFKVRCNLFTTKAAEALSRGVPLVVSSKLTELSTFVRENECGLIYDPDEHRVIYPEKMRLDAKSDWLRLTENAKKTGQLFTQTSTIHLYTQKWKTLLSLEKS